MQCTRDAENVTRRRERERERPVPVPVSIPVSLALPSVAVSDVAKGIMMGADAADMGYTADAAVGCIQTPPPSVQREAEREREYPRVGQNPHSVTERGDRGTERVVRSAEPLKDSLLADVAPFYASKCA
ncbi:hypothetical protein KIPB_011801 [Kipferlia bialata]|uniref:Uncharacterized protein n=1 Tax=Kipferlia bialata TaxID=797122 RepID=A0A391NZR3_9EUKA|nr:hypothetical protein KIPB_011801 [Kipferlia bialata]|eukprot:g11801.t1